MFDRFLKIHEREEAAGKMRGYQQRAYFAQMACEAQALFSFA
jgi:hypothetical protein